MNENSMVMQLREIGYGIVPPAQHRIDIESDFLSIWKEVSPYTMTSLERGYALYKAVEYICKNDLSGDFVECGVWKGGSVMLMALALKKFKDKNRKIFLYDTFSGITEPTNRDIIAWNNCSVIEKRKKEKSGKKDNFKSWAVSLEEVKKNINTTEYPDNLFVFVKGDVLKTLNTVKTAKIALLRLDTDWYESTRRELEVLFPCLSKGGVLIIDDYGHFRGARDAVDEYFKGKSNFMLLNRIDYTGRIGIKI